MRDEKGNITIKSIYKWLRSEKGKKYSFVIFYLIFFIVLFIFFMFPDVDMSIDSDKPQEEASLPFQITNFEYDIYKFSYTTEINSLKTTYQGEREEDKLTLTTPEKSYSYYYKDQKLESAEADAILSVAFLNIYNLKKILDVATLITEVKFPATSEVEYNYEITNEKLGEILESSHQETEVNKITVKADKDNRAISITFDILNYMNENMETAYENYLVILKYGE